MMERLTLWMEKLPVSWLQQARERRYAISALIVAVTYTVGIVAVKILNVNGFLALTPLQLLTSFGLLLWNHEGRSAYLWRFAAVAFLTGYFVEVAGVATGVIFGEYQYGEVLGLKVWNTPLLIGVNWAMLVYVCNAVLNKVVPKTHFLLRVAAGALLLVGMDWLIEPVAIEYGMWTWSGGTPPLQNYLAWYIVSFALSWVYHAWMGASSNRLAPWLLAAQLAFFLVLGL